MSAPVSLAMPGRGLHPPPRCLSVCRLRSGREPPTNPPAPGPTDRPFIHRWRALPGRPGSASGRGPHCDVRTIVTEASGGGGWGGGERSLHSLPATFPLPCASSRLSRGYCVNGQRQI